MASSFKSHSCSPRLLFVGKLDQGSIKFSQGLKVQLRFGLIMCEERFNDGLRVWYIVSFLKHCDFSEIYTG